MKNKMSIKRKILPWLLVGPGLLLVFGYLAYPLIENIRVSFLHYSLFEPNNQYFNDFENYTRLFKDPYLVKVLLNSLIWCGCVVGLQFFLGLLLAVLLNRKFRGRSFVQSVVFIPWAVAGFLVGFMFRWIFAQNNGILNYFLMSLGFIKEPIVWLANQKLVMVGPITAQVWAGIPFFGIMLLAALQSVPQEVLESAQVDGARSWPQFFYITLPYIRPTLITSILLRVIWTFNSGDVIYSMTQGGPNYGSSILTLYAYNQAFASLDFGYAAAISNIITIILLIFAGIYLWLTKYGKEDAE